MKCIVPLAGPDFFDPSYGAKPFVDVGGQTLIEATVGARSWLKSGAVRADEIIFVLRDTPVTVDAEARLLALFPGARNVRLSHLTHGALLSALAGAAFAANDGGPVLVDLADLAFDSDDKAIAAIVARPDTAGLIPWFHASDAAYSYLRFESERVVETAEKIVISDKASAGVYFFGSASLLLRAAAGCLGDARAPVNGALFVCPAYNVLIADGATVRGVEVTNVRAYSKNFHASTSARTSSGG